ncbi:hypothetical protein CCACVL1_24315 [Corchorus capsularis]|uniref:Uncharacterized protein n=1 Tax=Corchorus capsularis TaxID=210143 RepID=A0A1R3GQ99_COCAP|nr:hypothetical protein CCACVL1_24315 [Corchorus capsularis]
MGAPCTGLEGLWQRGKWNKREAKPAKKLKF